MDESSSSPKKPTLLETWQKGLGPKFVNCCILGGYEGHKEAVACHELSFLQKVEKVRQQAVMDKESGNLYMQECGGLGCRKVLGRDISISNKIRACVNSSTWPQCSFFLCDGCYTKAGRGSLKRRKKG